ncbi:MAG: hypothetical protein H7146_12280 [Burkholderiaceae bacterium]|nr:hypothetical protein [Microbacteriaceae bacterium]
MNNTNRFLNRTFAFVVGLVLLVLGVGAVVVGAVQQVRDGFAETAPTVVDTVTGWFAAAPVPGLEHSWWYIAIIAVLVLLIVLLLVFIFRQGRGHTGTLFTDAPTGEGQVTVDSRVAEQLMQSALDAHPELVSSRISTYDVAGTPVLKIRATARRGVSPKLVVDVVESHLASLGAMLGREVPAAIQVSGGFRAQTSKTTRLS